MRVHFVVSFDLPPDATPAMAHGYVQEALYSYRDNLIPYHPPALDAADPKRIISNASGQPMYGLDVNTIQTMPAIPR